MRIILGYSRAIALITALIALAALPAAASAAPKKVFFRFAASSYRVSEAGGSVKLAVLRSGNTRVDASIDYATHDGTAAAPGDYGAAAGTISFAAGETRKTIEIPIVDNTTIPATPSTKFTVVISNPASTAVTQLKPPTTATVTILDNDGPGTIDFSSATYSVAEGAGLATITVSRVSNPNLIETVDYATSDGTATSGSDYGATAGTLTFNAGQTTKTFQIPITDDQAFEGDETLQVALSNPQNVTDPLHLPALGTNADPGPAVLTIVDDDIPTFDFSSPTYSVGEADTTFDVTVVRGGATYVSADIGYSDLGTGTATAGSDYATIAPGTVHFAAGQTSATFPVTIKDDAVVEGNETIDLALSDSSGQVATAQLSIVDDDNTIPSVQFSAPTYSVSEAATSVTVTATLSGPAAVGDVTVHYATANGTASAGSDYTAKSGTLTIPSGQRSADLTIDLSPDTVPEDDETFTVGLTGPVVNAVIGAPATTTVTIRDDDSTGRLAFSANRYEVNETAGHATITVNRVGGAAGSASVDYTTLDGTAHEPGDYTATTGTLNFAAGETQKTFDVPVAWDGVAEGDETVSLELSNFASDDDPDAQKVAVLHIADDGASGPVQFSAASYTAPENGGPATITVSRSGGSLGGPVTVDYATADGTAHAGSDYTATSGTLTFGPGEDARTFQVPVADDAVHQGSRTVNVGLANPGGGTSLGATSAAVLTITDDEPVSASSGDRTAPKLKLIAKKRQKALKRKRIVLKVRSNEAAKLKVTAKLRKGSKRITVAKASRRVGKGKTVTIRLKLSKKARAKLRKGLVKHRAKVVLTVTGTDAAGNRATVRRTIIIR